MIEYPRVQKPPLGVPLRDGHWSTRGMAAHYGFNEAGGGTAYDLRGNNPGSFFNGPTWRAGAVEFNGVNQGIRIVSGIPPIGNNLAFHIRFRTDDVGTNVRALFGGDNAANAIHIRLFGTRVDIYVPGAIVAQSTATGIVVGKWHTLVYTRNGTGAGTHAIYIDGISRVLSTDAADNFSDTTQEKWIGIKEGSDEDWLGGIDFVSIYNRGLLASEASELSSNPNIVYQPSVIPFASAAAPAGVLAAYYYRTLLQGGRV